jgi:O-succinylbenzoic acid--CoA ligase
VARVVVTGPESVPAAVARVLDGSGEVIAPLPVDRAEAATAVAMLRLDEPEPTPDAAFIVATSGSTGRPKGVILTRTAVLAAAEAAHARLGGPGRWTCVLPVSYVAGLMVLARSHVAGAPARVVGAGPVPRAGAERSYLSVVPTHLHRALADQDQIEALASYDAVLVGGAALSPDLRARAEQAGIRLVSTYGATETCGGVVYDGRPLDGTEVAIDADERIRLTGPSVFAGYRLDPVATAAALDGRTYVTADRGAWDGSSLTVLGRLDDVVISGGVNVDLAELQRVVDEVYGAERVVVLAVSDQRWGHRVVAASVDSEAAATVREAVAARLAPAAVPRECRVLASFPRLASGKIDRRALVRDWTTEG